MYSGHRLIELLEAQHEARSQSHLFRKGTFNLQWRAKVGSFPHPDLETIVSAGEPCGAWKPSRGRPEDKRNVGENWTQLDKLPLYGYIPGSSIRGLVRSWASKHPNIKPRMYELLGYQDNDTIRGGKVEFLDAWPEEPTHLKLDIVNPQESFQVFHKEQSKPLSLYTLGNGDEEISVTVAIRGIPKLAGADEVEEVWGWVQQALTLYGVGSRTASGYGTLQTNESFQMRHDPGYARKEFQFSLYSQGCAGPDMKSMELRPSHWRGWLRSWTLRFMLGVMSQTNAQATVNELFGTLEPESCQGCVRLQMFKRPTWQEPSKGSPRFYLWQGTLQLDAPEDILNQIVLPIVRFAVSVGGVGRGWRRPLHKFQMKRGDRYEPASRGAHLLLFHQTIDKKTQRQSPKLFALLPQTERWAQTYKRWLDAVSSQWSSRIQTEANQELEAEVFSPSTCAVYVVPGPNQDPIILQNRTWSWGENNSENTRGQGMSLIYTDNPCQSYKRNPAIGGNAGSGSAHCSWASIKRINVPYKEEDFNTDCQEIVCLFMGGKVSGENHPRSQFLKDLSEISGSTHLFGVKHNV